MKAGPSILVERFYRLGTRWVLEFVVCVIEMKSFFKLI